MTQQCGWSVRTWDRIPAGSPVCAMYGEVITPEMVTACTPPLNDLPLAPVRVAPWSRF